VLRKCTPISWGRRQSNAFLAKNWKTFHDFLRDFVFNRLGERVARRGTGKASFGTPQEILLWFHRDGDTTSIGTKYGDVYTATIRERSGLHHLAYNIISSLITPQGWR